MSAQSIELGTLAAYVDHEAARWREWFDAAPADVLDLPLGPGADGTIRTLVKHIFAVELRYAQRLLGEPVSAYEDLPDRSVAQLWDIQRSASSLLDRFLALAAPEDMDRILISDTRKLGRIESRAHTIAVHALIHAVRHWAQIAMVLRQHGHGGLWEHDWLLSPVVQRATTTDAH